MTPSPLARYGKHDMECLKRAGATRFYGQHPCSCGLDAAIEREAAPLLDLDRLAEAFALVQPTLYGEDWPRDDPDDFQFVNPRQHAERIAAEYARLSDVDALNSSSLERVKAPDMTVGQP